ncbi:unnamed protein product, partial [Rotaria sordida]
SDVVELTGGP